MTGDRVQIATIAVPTRVDVFVALSDAITGWFPDATVGNAGVVTVPRATYDQFSRYQRDPVRGCPDVRNKETPEKENR